MIVTFGKTGSVGIVADTHSSELPPEAWSGGQNVAFKDGSVERINGHSATTYSAPSVVPYGITYGQNAGANWWLYGDLDKLYSLNVTTHTEVTRASGVYTMASTDKWHFASLGAGVVIANNQVDDPQLWTVSATACTDLTNWPASTTCKVMRSLRSHLIAMDVTESGTRYENKLRWSTPADPGGVPASWAEADPTKTSGSTNIGSDSPIVDMISLGESGIIYKANDAWRMTYVGGQFIWDFSQLPLPEVSMLALGCGVQLGSSHVVLTSEDIIQHNGVESQSLIESRMKRWLFNEIDTTLYNKTFAIKNEFRKEIYFCFVASGGTSINTALVWDYALNTFTIKELPSILCASNGIVDGVNTVTYDTITDTYDSSTDTYHTKKYSPTAERILMGTADTTLLMDDDSVSFNGTDIIAYCEKTGLSLGIPQNIKLVKSVRPRFDAPTGTQIRIYVGTQSYVDGPISWGTPQIYTVGTDYKVDFLKSGRYIGIRFETVGGKQWRLNSFDIDVEPQGLF